MDAYINSNVTIVIPNFNNRNLLENLLLSLKNVIDYSNIIIVDNNSSDDSINFIKNNYPDIKLIENDENKGFAYAVNQGIRLVPTDFVFLLNNDTVVEKDTIFHLLKTISTSDDIFSVSSKMIQYHNKELIDDVGDEYTIFGWSKRRGYGKSVESYIEDEEVFGACAGAALYRMSVFDEIGLFDENFESYVEDMDISFRARLHGFKSFYSAKSIVYHYGSASTGSRYNSFKVRISARNNIYLIYKNMSFWMKIVNCIFLIIGFFIKYLFFRHKGFGSEYYSGLREGLRTCNKLTKTSSSFKHSFKTELLMIKNTLTYLK